jgi:hypothetical protein
VRPRADDERNRVADRPKAAAHERETFERGPPAALGVSDFSRRRACTFS